MTVADDDAESQFGSLMKAVRRENSFDPSLPLTITVRQKSVGYTKSLEGCYHVSLKIVALLGEKVVGIESHDPQDNTSSDVLWLSGYPETELSCGRAIFVTHTPLVENHWIIDECTVSKVGRNGTHWTVTVLRQKLSVWLRSFLPDRQKREAARALIGKYGNRVE